MRCGREQEERRGGEERRRGEETRRGDEERRGEEEQATDIKSNNPHLAGGEQHHVIQLKLIQPEINKPKLGDENWEGYNLQ